MLERAGNAGGGDPLLGQVGDVPAKECKLACARALCPCDQVEHRALTGTVGTNEANDLTGLDVKAHLIDGNEAAEALDCALDAKQWRASSGLGPPRQWQGAGQGWRRGSQRRQSTNGGHDTSSRVHQNQ